MPSPSRTVAPKSHIRVRRKHHKVWTGCLSCKAKHVKCSEEAPICGRCQRTNTPCVYRTPQARIFELPAKLQQPAGQSSSPDPRSSESVEAIETQAAVVEVHRAPAVIDPTRSPNLARIRQRALMDAFLTIWLPKDLIRGTIKVRSAGTTVPMSAWPSIAWKLAKDDDQGFVAQSLLCLTLATIAARTHDLQLRMEASRHYSLVLRRFQTEIDHLAQTRDPNGRSRHLSSLLAAGFCASQLEFILHSWAGGDRHLEGLASLLHTCGASSLRHKKSKSIAYDHSLLWSSCSVVHRRRTARLHHLLISPENHTHPSDHSCTPELVEIAERIAGLLEDYDSLREQDKRSETPGHLQRLADIITDIDMVQKSLQSDAPSTVIPTRHNPAVDSDALTNAVQSGYAAAFTIQSVLAGWNIISYDPHIAGKLIPDIFATEQHLRTICEHHVYSLQRLVTGLTNEKYGMVTASPVLFFLDSIWMGHSALARYCGKDLSDAIAWAREVGKYMISIGYRPLREPWVSAQQKSSIEGN